MDEIALQFEAADLGIARGDEAPHPRFSAYKKNPKADPASNQERRRLALLETQRQSRAASFNMSRLLNFDPDDDDDVHEGSRGGTEASPEGTDDTCGADAGSEVSVHDDVVDMEETSLPGKASRKSSDRKRGIRVLASVEAALMLSEWMIEVPLDLETNWLVTVVPMGKRCLVVASMGQTLTFDRRGRLIHRFPSSLPGGHRHQPKDRAHRGAVLDTILVGETKTHYVLDLILWNESYVGCDTQFRVSWRDRKLLCEDESPGREVGFDRRGPLNPFAFVPLPFYDLAARPLGKVVAKEDYGFDGSTAVDGVLFYHKEALYLPGKSPLVCWLKGYMLPEMLNVEIGKAMEAGKPNIYSGMKNEILAFEEHSKRLAEARRQRQRNNEPGSRPSSQTEGQQGAQMVLGT